jgi:hypothetical protein
MTTILYFFWDGFNPSDQTGPVYGWLEYTFATQLAHFTFDCQPAHYALADSRSHFAFDPQQAHYAFADNRTHFTMTEEG